MADRWFYFIYNITILPVCAWYGRLWCWFQLSLVSSFQRCIDRPVLTYLIYVLFYYCH